MSVKIEGTDATLYNDFMEESFYDDKEYVYFPKNQGGLFIPHYAGKVLPNLGIDRQTKLKKSVKSLQAGEGLYALQDAKIKHIEDHTIMVDW